MHAYRCADCGAECELLVRSTDPLPVCPSCGSADLRRALSRVAPPGQSAKLVSGARKLAAKEGHFSNYSKGERRG
ncbi:zinc ribbon domain-containing protein [Rhodovulum strictum]